MPEINADLSNWRRIQSKLNKLRLDYDVKINQSPVEKEIDSIRTFAQKESDRQDAENEKELEA